jgi:hypothetical protein
VRGAAPETMSGLSIVVAGACYLSICQTCTSGAHATRRAGNSVLALGHRLRSIRGIDNS